ncbi:uncharacterized protein LOC109514554 isoform X2 [Hippocampus comes]|uniref:uncharacterized protein LOC109514554 isoform X2 n=1 Tax=Hippocampus comes TaxID=109280 RepID=UPI00094E9250|nr:PREDICTED: uncharacterized protein LOC109514554 isoform X2 [Hippocampus comes]
MDIFHEMSPAATDGHPPKLVSDDGAEVGKAVRRGSDCSRAAASRFGPSDNWAPPQEIESLLVNWSGPDLSGFGELVLEGSFKVHRVKKERAFFLFDKMLLIAKKRLERFVYSTHIFCCNLLLVDALKEPLCFRVSDLMIPKQQHVVQTKNMEEKRLWVHYLKKLIVENHPATLPHKARQVLGDNICQSPQFEHDHLKKFSSASPRPDDVHAYRRGRRQSEPPQLLTYTPEKSRKSLPLLLEGSLPYRRTRRQSAPAKDLEAAFNHHALKQADGECGLNRADCFGWAGSSGAPASSVIPMESERNREREQEDDEEDFAALCAPPTLSITEEILELINQSRAREALVSPDRVLDQPTESQPPPYQSNFTCPLPPVASTPEDTLGPDPLREDVETRPNRAVEEQTASPQIGLESAHVVHEKGQNASRAEEASEQETDIRNPPDKGEPGKPLILPTPPSAPTDFPSSNSVTEDRQASRTFYEEEAADPSTNPDDSHRASPSDKPKRGSALTQRDKRIIEKIRSYYEAAAELVEDEEAEDAGREHDETSERRNSSSQVPTETVKDSVSRFTSDHQDEGRKEAVETEPDHDVALPSPAGPASPLLPEDSHNHDGHADMPTRLMDVEAKDGNKSPLFTRTDDDEVFVNLPSSGIQSSQVEEKTERGSGNFSNEQSQQEPNEGAENSQREATPWQEEGPFTQSNDTSQSVPPELARTKGSEWQLKEPKEEKESLTESSGTLSSTPQCPETTPAWTGSKHKGTKTSRNLEELPSQTQLGRGSRQSRIVSTNRALFEGMVSDITGIGLFEASPVADPSLMENSERILSKVQTLASMYSAKASTMKVPLHQKRAIFIRNKAGDLTGPSSLSSQTQCHSQAKCRLGGRRQPKCDVPSQAPAKVAHTPRPTSDEQTDTKNGSQRFSRSKAQSGSLTRTENGSHVPAKAQMLCERQNHGEADGKNQNLTVSRRDIGSLDQRVTPERMDVSKTAVPSEEPSPARQLQSHGFTFSRPRDFIAAPNKEQNCGRPDDKLQSTTAPEAVSTAVRRPCSSGLSQEKSHTLRSELREHVYTEDTASVNSIVKHSALSSHTPHWNASKGEDGHSHYKQDSAAVQGKREPHCQIPAKDHENASEPSKDRRSVRSGLEHLAWTASSQADSSPGERSPLSSAEDLTSSQHRSLFVSKPKQLPRERPREALNFMGGRQHAASVSAGSSKEALPTMNKTECEVNGHSQQTWKSLPDVKAPGPTFQRPQREGPSPLSSMQVLESNVAQAFPPTAESHERLPKFTGQKPLDFQAVTNTGKVHFSTLYEYGKPEERVPGRPTSLPIFGSASGRRSPPRASLDVFCQVETSRPLTVTRDEDTHFRASPAVFRHISASTISASAPSPNPTPSSFPVRVTACPSPFVVAPLSPPAALADEDLVSPETPSGTRLACFSALPSSGRSFSDRAPPPSSAPHSSACSRALSKGARPSSPRPPSSCRSPPGSPPVASSSTFTRSLAASCISQTLAKKNNGRHQVQSSSTQSPSPTPSFPSSHLPRCSPSPQLSHSQKVTLTPAYSQLGAATDRNPRYPPSPLRPTCPSPSSVQSTFHSNSQNFSPPSSPFIRQSHRQPFSSASAHPHHHSLRHNVAFAQNDSSSICLPTSSNYGLGSGTSSPGPPKVQLVNADTNITAAQHAGDRLSFGSHNRMARPFSASEPNSRVQSPSPAVSPPSITRLRSPPLLQSSSSAMANERPRPRCSGPGGASSHNPLGLTLNIPEASAASLPTGPASSRASPQVLSPPAIGVSVWTCNVTAPRPRNPQFISPSRSVSTCSGQTSLEKATSALPHGSRAGSPQGHALQRSLSSPSDTCQIPAQSEPGDPRDSWSGSSPRCLGFDRQESGLASPRSGWSSCGGSATCLSPRAGLQSPVSPGRFTPRRSDFGGEHFSGEPWLDGQLLCNNCNAHGGFYTSGTSTAIPSTSPLTSLAQSPCSSMAVDWEDPELGQGSCRSQLICAYIGRPPPEANFASSRLVRSPPPAARRQIYRAHVQSPPQATDVGASASSPATFARSSPSKVPQQKPSYATTVNLQIAGSGRITSFSTAHVSVSQTPPGRPGRGEIHSARRVSINGLSPVPSPLPQNCGQL